MASYDLSLGGSRAAKPDAARPSCDAGDGDACPAPSGCDPGQVCEITCSSDDDCSHTDRPVCDGTRHVCVQCYSDADCEEQPGAPHCVANRCRA